MTTNYIAAETTIRAHVIEAAHAHTNLNTFGAIKAILEGGLIYGRGRHATRHESAEQILSICNRAMAAELKLHDAAIAKAIAAAREVPKHD